MLCVTPVKPSSVGSTAARPRPGQRKAAKGSKHDDHDDGASDDGSDGDSGDEGAAAKGRQLSRFRLIIHAVPPPDLFKVCVRA